MNKIFSFHIKKLEKWSSDLSDYGALRKLTKLQARRMTDIGKKTVDLALICTKEEQVDFVVYASRHGELNISFELIQSILKREVVSPIKFSQSTHNVIQGLYCIQGGRKVPSTAIAAGTDSFKMGLIAANNYLLSNPKHNVLFIFADAHVPDPYIEKVGDKQNDRVLCALIHSGDTFSYQLSDEIHDLVLS